MSGMDSVEFRNCACGQPLPSRGAMRCRQCRAAHARALLGKRAAILRELPRIAPHRREATWVACNLERNRISWDKAPSLRAVNVLAAFKKDEKLRRAFWLAVFKPRSRDEWD